MKSAAIIGDASLTGQCVEIAVQHGLDVVLVATADPGTGALAERHGIPTYSSSDDLAELLDRHPADALLSIAHLRLVPEAALARVGTAINFHDGPLPDYAGLNVTCWSIVNGERRHGITWHRMTAAVDAGAIVEERRFDIAERETAFSLNARCFESALESFPTVVRSLLDDDVAGRPQPERTRPAFRRIDRPVVLVDGHGSAADLDRSVRGLTLGALVVNPMGSVKLVGPEGAVVVNQTQLAGGPGPVVGMLAAEGGAVRLTTVDADVLLRTESASGAPLDGAGALGAIGLASGDLLPDPSLDRSALESIDRELAAAEPGWVERIIATADGDEDAHERSDGPHRTITRALPDAADTDAVLAAVTLWARRVRAATSISVTDARARQRMDGLAHLVSPPFAAIGTDDATDLAAYARVVRRSADIALAAGPFLTDLVGRIPSVRGRSIDPDIAVRLDDDGPAPHAAAVTVAVGSRTWSVCARTDDVDRVADQIEAVLESFTTAPTMHVDEVEVCGREDRALFDRVNQTSVEFDSTETIDQLFRRCAEANPTALAVTASGRSVTYGELRADVDVFAARLAAVGVGRGDTVGIALDRSIDMVRSVLAVLQCGAAYVPLDPSYPLDRLQHMVYDSGTRVVVADADAVHVDDLGDVLVVHPDLDASGASPAEIGGHDGTDLAYVIYTSGSTGMPKGVMLEHRNVVNFFIAMDEVIDHDPPGVWLAVTSLSFDISVLELLWTLTRGFHVVVSGDTRAARGPAGPTRPTSMSLFYFAAGDETARGGYRLLLESARWADQQGFEAVWTPERHFHEFGGAYPNPSVIGAALAASTERIAIRAGSVVAPLHQPPRIAEEWAVVDNLSGGRVGISFAPGWQPDDFVLNPGAYAGARESLPATIETITSLWRGDTVTLPGPDGRPVDVRTLPRPTQPELPVWLTSAGTPETFERAGQLGMNVLTHLLGQSHEQLRQNIDRYRQAWHAAGHAGEGHVTLMLHTYLDRSADDAKRVARAPMKSYLSTATGLIKNMASAFPTFTARAAGSSADEAFRSLTPDELDQLLEMAADRYLDTSGLFGTVDDAVETISACSAAGVDEVACLVDFGIDDDRVLDSLPLLGEVHDIVRRGPTTTEPEGFATLVRRHGVTHLQCTPSLATMLTADPVDRAALEHVGHLMLGGEALPTALAAELRGLLPGRFTNMYGPTETTIWSLVHEIDEAPTGTVPIGRPIANTAISVLDERGRHCPVGTFGQLHIGGAGVARGYHERDELTAERFVERPGTGRTYATGDVVRLRPDGVVEFAGRTDHQVKIRGHRVELGEIEAHLDRLPEVATSIVVAARSTAGDPRLIGFVLPTAGSIDVEAVRTALADGLPDAYVPSRLVVVDAFPLTPNGKTDRNRLIDMADDALRTTPASETPSSFDGVEAIVAQAWIDELGHQVGRDDNFFEIGGNSLLAVSVYKRLCDRIAVPLALTDVFRFPTVRTLASHIATATGGTGDQGPDQATDRGARRRQALRRRG